ncbi:hypothetical protein [Thioclava nitratireducens]|uniref:hypothetical protein n=1 Tax=Thioclava nitratireducens TaxID=1915078 RepID=UPI002480FE87|nr:hypothetical protein [Thioclava nitratireducens]WGT48902.1 hypothetical protein P0N61_11245 [Thioclava nitratireducens]
MKTENSIPEICELGIRLDQVETVKGDLRCIAEFRLYNGDLPIGDHECQVSISKATISIELEGLEPSPGTRFGEPRKNNSVPVKSVTTRETSRSGAVNFAGSASLKGAKGSASAKFDASSQEGKAVEADDSYEHLRVRALPQLRWEVSEHDGKALDGTYLEEDQLVALQRTDRANRTSFRASVTVKQRDLLIAQIADSERAVDFFSRLNTSQRRLLDIFIAKSLSSALNYKTPYRGEIKLSEHVSEVPDAE